MSSARRPKRKTTQARQSDPARWAHLIFVLGGFLGAWVLTNFIEEGWDILFTTAWPALGRPNPLSANIFGIGIAIAATLFAWRRRAWFQYATEVVTEVAQVSWPTRAEVRVATIVVIVMTLICSAILFTIDTVWSNVTDLLYGIE